MIFFISFLVSFVRYFIPFKEDCFNKSEEKEGDLMYRMEEQWFSFSREQGTISCAYLILVIYPNSVACPFTLLFLIIYS